MKLGVFTPLFADLSLDEMLDKVQQAGLDAVEVGTGGCPGNHHCPIDELLASETYRAAYIAKFQSRGIIISALSCHDNPISPVKAEREAADALLRKTIKLASLLGVPVVNTFSGTAGSDEHATAPNWPVVAWPTVYSDIKTWQWENRIIPYWREIGLLAQAHQVKIGIELHGGFLCHTPYTLLKLREATSTSWNSNVVRVTGFSHITCLPASSARMASALCTSLGVAISTNATSLSSSSASKLGYATRPCDRANRRREALISNAPFTRIRSLACARLT